MKDNHPVAGSVTCNSLPHRRHHTRRLMSINARRRKQVVLDLLQIGMADTARLNADQDLTAADFGNRNRFHLHHAGALVHGGLHG